MFEIHAPFPFIVGAPRSGTTLLRLMLDSHPDLAIPPETGFLPRAARLHLSLLLRPRLFNLVTRSTPAWSDFHLDRSEFCQALEQIRPFTVSEGIRAFYRLYAQKHGKFRSGDKTPLYALEMPAIRSLLPEAHFIHIIRDGRDVALSLRKTWFTPSKEITALARYWVRIVKTARAQGRNSSTYFELRYEDLLTDTEVNLRAICRSLQLDFHPCMLEYWRTAPQRLEEHEGRNRRDGTVVVTRDQRLEQQRLTTYPPQLNRAGGWRQAMSVQEAKAFRDVAGPLLEELGYEF
jgi:DNA-binding transcriptional ArsR family regulator